MTELLTTQEVAKRLNCHAVTVRKLMKDGKLGDVIRDGRKFIRVKSDAVDAYIRGVTK